MNIMIQLQKLNNIIYNNLNKIIEKFHNFQILQLRNKENISKDSKT